MNTGNWDGRSYTIQTPAAMFNGFTVTQFQTPIVAHAEIQKYRCYIRNKLYVSDKRYYVPQNDQISTKYLPYSPGFTKLIIH